MFYIKVKIIILMTQKEGVEMNKGKRFIEKYRHGFPKKSRGRYSTKTYLCTVILLTAMILGICTTPGLLLGQWKNTEAATADTWNGTDKDTSWLNTGDGSEGNPYKIATGAQLAGLAQKVNDPIADPANTYSGKYFKLTADIDLASHEWTPIGRMKADLVHTTFDGNFDGGGHTISNLFIANSSDFSVGLFGFINNATISTLNVSGSITISKASLGGIAGACNYRSIIEYCSSSVDITASEGVYFGGIVGTMNDGTIQYCYNTGNITSRSSSSYSYLGGIAGQVGPATIIGCYNTGTVQAAGTGTGTQYAGGIVGSGGNINFSYNVGKVSANDSTSKIGGLIGSAGKSTAGIENNYWLEGCGATYDYGDSSTEIWKKTEAELKGTEVLDLLNSSTAYGIIYEADTANQNKGYPILIKNPPPKSDEVTLGSGESVNDVLGKLNPGGTIHVGSTITVSGTETWDGTSLIDESGKKVTIDGGTQTDLPLVKVPSTGNLTVKDLDFVGSGVVIDCDSGGQLTLENVKITGSSTVNGNVTLKNVETTGEMNGNGTLTISGKVVVSSTNLNVVVNGDLEEGSAISLNPTENGQEIVKVSSPKTSLTDTEKGYFTILDSDYRLVTKQPSGTTSFTTLYAYLKPTWSVNINTDTSGEIRLTPTLTNFVDGDYGDKLKVKILYPTNASSFTLDQGDDSVVCQFSLDNSIWFTNNNQSIDFTSGATAKTLYYKYDSDAPKYSGIYTGKVMFEGTLTYAT